MIARIVAFLIWPFISLIVAIRSFNLKSSRIIIIMFLGFYGFSIVASSMGADIYRLKSFFENSSNTTFNDYWAFLISYGGFEGTTDIILQSISFVVSRFVDDYRFFFLVLALLLGAYYIKSAHLVFKSALKRKATGIQILFIFFLFVIPIFEINRFRFFTAALIYFTIIYDYFVNNNTKGVVFKLLLAPLLHFTFIAPYLLFLFYRVNLKISYFYLILFILSFIYSNLVLNFLPDFNLPGFLGNTFTERFEGYTNLDYIAGAKEAAGNNKFIIRIHLSFPYYLLSTALIAVWFRIKSIRTQLNPNILNLLSFYFLISTFTNIMLPIVEGERFYSLSFLFGLSALIYTLAELKLAFSKIFVNSVTIILFIPFFLFCLVRLRQGLELTDPMIFISNPVAAYFLEQKESIISLIK